MKQEVIDGVQVRLADALANLSQTELQSFQQKLESYTTEIMQRVAHYIHVDITALPTQLQSVLISMTCDMIKNNSDLEQGDAVKALSLGDASIQFATNLADGIDNLVRAYKSDLHPYRCMAW